MGVNSVCKLSRAIGGFALATSALHRPYGFGRNGTVFGVAPHHNVEALARCTAIKDLDLRTRYGISIVALQKEVARVSVFGKQSIQSHSNRNPQPDDVIEAESTLLIAGHPRDITKFAEEFG